MCGIIGACATDDIMDSLLYGLNALEYRGYDSAGLSIFSANTIKTYKSVGKVKALEDQCKSLSLQSNTGIAHTRWATHGTATINNAHPHNSQQYSLVHNGIIENYKELKSTLGDTSFYSQTDSEVLVKYIQSQKSPANTTLEALRQALSQVKGSYAICMLDNEDPGHIYAACNGSPLILGIGSLGMYIASDISALLRTCSRFVYLQDGDLALINNSGYEIFNLEGHKVERSEVKSDLSQSAIDKGRFEHFLLKEIYEQPQCVTDTIAYAFEHEQEGIESKRSLQDLYKDKIDRITLVGCGTSYHAALCGKYFFEKYLKIPCSVEIASEFRYKEPLVEPNTLFLCISQSGETADTLEALKLARTLSYTSTLCICNVASSSMVRECDYAFITRAGKEVAVASTKAFAAQLTALMLITYNLLKNKDTKFKDEAQSILKNIKALPDLIQSALNNNETIKSLARNFTHCTDIMYLGRSLMLPIALEGALKLTEISYIHAQGLPAGELKHGPLALIDNSLPVVMIAPDNSLLDKIKCSIEEIKARGGQIYVFAAHSALIDSDEQVTVIKAHSDNEFSDCMIFTLMLQLLAYHVALLKGCNVDRPRNLAKSVTVE